MFKSMAEKLKTNLQKPVFTEGAAFSGMVLSGYNEERKAISLQVKQNLDYPNDKLYTL